MSFEHTFLAHKMKSLAQQTLLQIVDRNYVHAAVLRWFGISFYKQPNDTLQKVCAERGLEVEKVIFQLESSQYPQGGSCPGTLYNVSVDVIIAYLKQTHRRFIRERLPYMAELVENIKTYCFDDPAMAEDLKFIFPLFLEDFVKHIFEEEQTQFSYMLRLHRAAKGKFSLTRTYYDLEDHSVEDFADHHHDDDDEMAGIRNLTNEYLITPTTGTYTKVIFSELKSFEKELLIHSRIEDNILFPKALKLENKVKKLVERRAKLN